MNGSVIEHVRTYLGGGTREMGNQHHKTNATAHLDELAEETRALLEDFYSVDYELFAQYGVQVT